MKVLQALGLLAVWLHATTVVSRCLFGGQSLDLVPRRSIVTAKNVLSARSLVSRGGRSKCAAPKPPAGPQKKRELSVPTPASDYVTHVRRMMATPTPGSEKEFIMQQTKKVADQIVWNGGSGENYYHFNTAVWRDFRSERSLASTHLKGCTVLAVITRKGVFMSHYWENISFSPDKEWIGDLTHDENFEETVLRPLREGTLAGKGDHLSMSFTAFVQECGDDTARAFLITPNDNDAQDGRGYPEDWAKLQAEVNKIMPVLSNQGRWQQHTYQAHDDEKVLDDTASGRVLFKFDPEHLLPAQRNAGFTMLWKFWLEENELANDQWIGPPRKRGG